MKYNLARKYGKRFAGMVGASLMKKAVNTATNYASRKASSYTRKRKASFKRPKPSKKPCLTRKTAKCVREIVKKELTKETPTGIYHKNYAGTLLLPGPGTNSQIAGDHVFWTEGQVQKQRLAFFTPAQLIDAASILFNAKVAAVPDTGTSGNFSDVELKFNIIYASASVVFRSFVQGIVDLNIYEVTAKHMEPDWFGEDYTDALEATNMNQVGGTTFNRSSLNVKPTLIEALKTRYSIKTISKRLQPGDSFTHFMSMKANTLFKKQDNFDGNVLQFVNKQSKQLFYSYTPVLSPIFDSGDSRLKIGRAYRTVASSATSLNCITCEVKEIFKIDCPEGGISPSLGKDSFCILNAYEPVISATGVSQITKDYTVTNTTFVADL